MCGISGRISSDNNSFIQEMVDSIKHRGPDNNDMLKLKNVELGHTRLSVLDLSENSNQPLWDINRHACIVFNGEIYNYKELRAKLVELGYKFTSDGDAEVIVNLYLEYGLSSFEMLNGIFAYALWDANIEELILIRDRFGVKPLYYTEQDQSFSFSSEIKSLLTDPNVSRSINFDAMLRTIVLLWSPGPETILDGVFKLEPGHYLRVKGQRIIEKYEYASLPSYTPKKQSLNQAKDNIEEALQSSIKEQLVSDVPLGFFLSGGLDSSLIVAMAKKFYDSPLECFTIKSMQLNGENDGFKDDLPYAKKVAQDLSVPLHIVEANPEIIKYLYWMVYHLDEPQADLAPLNVSLICSAAKKKGIKVLFSGAGGDDIFTGYRRHFAVRAEKFWSWMPVIFRKALQQGSKKLSKKSSFSRRVAKAFAYAALPEDERLLSYFYWMDPLRARNLFTDEVKAKLSDNPMSLLLNDLKRQPVKNSLEKMLYLERRYFLVDHNFNYTDKMSMAHGIEVRVPFLSSKVMDCASQIPTKLKCKGKQGKWILKKFAEKYLSRSIIYRKKSGFGVPLRHWLKHDLKEVVDDLLSESSLKRRGIFDYEEVKKIIDLDRSGEQDYSYSILSVLCIEVWCRIFIDDHLSKNNTTSSLNKKYSLEAV